MRTSNKVLRGHISNDTSFRAGNNSWLLDSVQLKLAHVLTVIGQDVWTKLISKTIKIHHSPFHHSFTNKLTLLEEYTAAIILPANPASTRHKVLFTTRYASLSGHHPSLLYVVQSNYRHIYFKERKVIHKSCLWQDILFMHLNKTNFFFTYMWI